MKIAIIPMATLAILIMSPVQAEQEERRLARTCLADLERVDSIASRLAAKKREANEIVEHLRREVPRMNMEASNLQTMERNVQFCDAAANWNYCNNLMQNFYTRRLQLQESERRMNNAKSRAQRLAREFDSLESGEYQRSWDRLDNSCDAAASARLPYHIWSQEAERYTIRTHKYRRILSNLLDTAR
ncbi:hypothetical protein [Aliidiomarina indica]|uniref:hypothetical protein n=1 Tax=Aliidiomarina indica TaxID=2749147 RepID=UPI00189088CB|nr:hypothetical protein [Aliidiomarina indica]